MGYAQLITNPPPTRLVAQNSWAQLVALVLKHAKVYYCHNTCNYFGVEKELQRDYEPFYLYSHMLFGYFKVYLKSFSGCANTSGGR